MGLNHKLTNAPSDRADGPIGDRKMVPPATDIGGASDGTYLAVACPRLQHSIAQVAFLPVPEAVLGLAVP